MSDQDHKPDTHSEHSSFDESEEERIDYSSDESEAVFTDEDSDLDDRKKPKRKSASRSEVKRRKKPRFVETEAEVGDEEEEEEEEEMDELTRQFIADDKNLEEVSGEAGEEEEDSNLDRYRALVQRQTAEDIDVGAEEQRLRSLYGRVARAPKADAAATVPTQFLLPSVTDPKLWLVRCRLGKERAAVHQLLRCILDSSESSSPLLVFSATALDTLKGYIYIEAMKPFHVAEAIERARITHWLFAGSSTGNKVVLVPLNEMTDVLKFSETVKVSSGELTMPELGGYVRIKRGKYSQDLAQVVEVPEEVDVDNLASVQVKLKLLPRLNYRDDSSGRSRFSSPSKDRPIARPFDQHEAAKHGSVTKSRGFWIYGGETYKDGFLYKDVRLSSLVTDSVAPLATELERLGISDTTGAADVTAPKDKPREDKVFTIGERVLVVSGELKNMVGRVEAVEGNSVKAKMETKNIPLPITVKMDLLERVFRLGDSVRVVNGEHVGALGMVVDIEKRTLTVYTESGVQLSLPKTSVRLTLASEPSATTGASSTISSFRASSRFAIYDLVQIGPSTSDFGIVLRVLDNEDSVQILDSTGTVRTEAIEQVKRIILARHATDQFKGGDRVTDASGSEKLVVVCYSGMSFVRKLEGSGDVLVVPNSQLSLIKKPEPHTKPAAPRFTFTPGGASMIGKSVSISGGQYKGYIGIVKELTDQTARVELHTNSKLVTVDRSRLVIVGDSSGPLRPSGAMTPAAVVGKTPAWGTLASGKTPAWNVGSGKTPAWNAQTGKTPAWSGTTPAWKAPSVAAKATPSWAPSRTPTWQPSIATAQTVPPPASSKSLSATWAIANVEVLLGNERLKIVSVDGNSLQASYVSDASQTKSVRLSDVKPVVPLKKDRVVIHSQSPPVFGMVIGLDGPDAVIKVDGTGEFKIVNISTLAKVL